VVSGTLSAAPLIPTAPLARCSPSNGDSSLGPGLAASCICAIFTTFWSRPRDLPTKLSLPAARHKMRLFYQLDGNKSVVISGEKKGSKSPGKKTNVESFQEMELP
jgi:hypothetical protein